MTAFELPPKGTRGVEMPRFLRPVIRATSGMSEVMFRLGMKVQGRPLLRLTTVGARTGNERRAVLAWFEDEGRPGAWIVVASGAGSARHPGWAHNLAKNPTRVAVDDGDRTTAVLAELLVGSEREAAWERISAIAPGYGRYATKTDRELPVVRLTPQPR